MAIRFEENDARVMGRNASGVKGIDLAKGDLVVGMVRLPADEQERNLLTVTQGGYGKRTELSAYPRKGRGTMGVRGIRLMEGRGGGVVGARMVSDDDEVILMSSGGTLIRTGVDEIAQQGRDASGVRVMNVDEGEHVAALAPVPASDDDEVDDEGDASPSEAASVS